jgi:DNA-binding transcriptional LysR family regulator
MAHTDPLSIRQLEVFVALVEQRSFTKAARHLGLSQSTVSGHIADLERRLGLKVVGRERSGVTPSGAGEVLLKPAREALRAEQNVRMAAAQMSGLLQGTLIVGGSTIPAAYLMPQLLARFRRAHQGVTVSLVTGDSADILEQVQHGDVDVGVVGLKPRVRGLVSRALAEDQVVLVVAADHPFAAGGTVTAEEVMDQPFVLREPGSGTRRTMLDALGVEESGRGLDVVCQVGSTEAVKAAVRVGLGVSFVSSLAVRDAVDAGYLATVDVQGLDLGRTFHLVAREPEDLSPAGKAFWLESAPTADARA